MRGTAALGLSDTELRRIKIEMQIRHPEVDELADPRPAIEQWPTDAYGWPAELPTPEVLSRLSASGHCSPKNCASGNLAGVPAGF